MSSKEEKARECVKKVFEEQYNSHLDSDDIRKAFNIGWDAATKELSYDVCEFIKNNLTKYHKYGVLHTGLLIDDLKKLIER